MDEWNETTTTINKKMDRLTDIETPKSKSGDELPKSSNNTKSYLEEYKNKFKAEQKQDTGNHEKLKYRCNNCKEFIDFSDTKCPWCGYDNF